MKEDFLHYLWKHKKVNFSRLATTDSEQVEVLDTGRPNLHSGPDFFNARMRIGTQQWAGNVEMHLKSSDWYVHGHENDPAYDNVILHVVWEHDVEVFRKDNTAIPTVQLQGFVVPIMLEAYQNLMKRKSLHWISCEKQLDTIPAFLMENWKERLYLERLEQKGGLIQQLLEHSSHDWEAVLFQLLAKNFGLKVNGEAFLSVARATAFSVVRKCSHDPEHIEALFFGQAGLLEKEMEEPYFKTLKTTYQYLKHKYQLQTEGVLPMQFFRLRPPNFPTIRWSQFANLYIRNPQLFAQCMQGERIEQWYEMFTVTTHDFWEDHYTFEKKSTSRKKKSTKAFIDLLLINTVIPLKFYYAKQQGEHIDEEIFEYMRAVPAEQNSKITRFKDLGVSASSALDTQALLQLKSAYCDKFACLQCAIGNHLLENSGMQEQC